MVNKTWFYLANNVPLIRLIHRLNSGNMKQRNSLTSNSKQTGRRPADMLDIYKLIYFIWLVWSLQQDWKISNEGPFFRFSWDRQKLLVHPTPVEKFGSQLGTWPAAIRVFLPKTTGGREERPWERGWSHEWHNVSVTCRCLIVCAYPFNTVHKSWKQS